MVKSILLTILVTIFFSCSLYYKRNDGEQITYDGRKYPEKDFDGIIQIQIEKKGDIFTCKLNDKDFSEYHVTARNVNYFPDKYYLGFELDATNKNAKVEIHRLELEHL